MDFLFYFLLTYNSISINFLGKKILFLSHLRFRQAIAGAHDNMGASSMGGTGFKALGVSELCVHVAQSRNTPPCKESLGSVVGHAVVHPKSIFSRAPNSPQAFFSAGAQKSAQSRLQEPIFLPVWAEIGTDGPRPNPARWGARGRRAIEFGAKERQARRVSNPRTSSSSSPRFPAGNQCQGCPPVSLPLIPHGWRGRGDAPPPATRTHDTHPLAAI